MKVKLKLIYYKRDINRKFKALEKIDANMKLEYFY